LGLKLAVIINPTSGKQGKRLETPRLRHAHALRLVDRPGIEAEVVLTTARGHGALLASDFVAKDFDVIVAWGGDGTVNEVAGPLVGSRTALAVVPSGSGDGLARGLGLPTSPDDALRAAIEGPEAAIDVGYLGDRHFLNMAGIGFDAAVATGFNNRTNRGGLAYVTDTFGTIWSYAVRRYRIELDGQVRVGPQFLVAFANGRQYGNGMIIAPDADPRDGWLNVVLVDDGTAVRQIWRSRRLFVGRNKPTAGITRTRTRRGSVSADRLICHVDGETFETGGTIDVRIAPRALRIRGLVG